MVTITTMATIATTATTPAAIVVDSSIHHGVTSHHAAIVARTAHSTAITTTAHAFVLYAANLTAADRCTRW
ncbi:hypothetical protein F5Y18DRAFT_374115 [Xylariaceae sp. FL1019]|nr:hypothetical protein F5Y18DRAFT_374115 [Xylariaceae sp. FL1019]